MGRTDPADGERRAVRGYRAQYLVAAELIYDALLEGDLDWIRVADPEAGRVDDIQIARFGKLDAYQIKWGEFTGAFTFQNLIKDKKTEGKPIPNLLFQLADGWTKLKSLHPERRVRVHLTTNSIASYSDTLPTSSPEPPHRHFQAFIRDCWQDRESWVLERDCSRVPAGWLPTIQSLIDTSGFDTSNFLRFACDCEFDFSFQLTEDERTLDVVRRVADIHKIATVLWDVVGGKKTIVEMDRVELLKRFDWEHRFEFRFRHEFPVDERLYQPIQSTLDELSETLSKYSKGYITIIGTPGSGKSTTLTQMLRYRSGFRVIRYYAYVRDDPSQGRGEALNFLHDVVLALQREGVYVEGYGISDSRKELLEKFTKQLGELHNSYVDKGIRTIILIDGLDHIEREQKPERSLIQDFPLPDQIPEGVNILLGTQTLELKGLSSRIKTHLEGDNRIVTMQPLDRVSIHAIVNAAGLEKLLTVQQKDNVVLLSDGHPLALNYLIQRLGNARNTDEAEQILRSTIRYKGHIEETYRVYWNSLKDDQEIRDLLGLFCRIRGGLDLNHAISWVGENTIERFNNEANHYFYKETATRWYFFHNSFRQFLLEITAFDIFGQKNNDKHYEYHRRLANLAAEHRYDSSWSWEELYHWACAGENEKVLDLFTQEYFRSQYFALRSLDEIREDITYCLKAARANEDALAVIRSFLIEKELLDREENLKDVNIPNLLLLLFGEEKAINYVIRGRELRITEKEALDFCQVLIRRGAVKAARRIFDAGEPLGFLGGLKKVNYGAHEDIELLESWAKIAFHFRPLEIIVDTIDSLDIDPKSTWAKDPDAANSMRSDLLFALAGGIYANGGEEALTKFKKVITGRSDESLITRHYDFICAVDAYRGKVSLEKGRNALNRIIDSREKEETSKSSRILIAELLLRLKDDEKAAKEWLNGIEQPDLCESVNLPYNGKTLGPFIDRIRFNRLLAALGCPADPLVAVPDSKNEREFGVVLLERMLVIISNIWGKAWRKDFLDPSTIVRELTPPLQLFNRPWDQTKDWNGWHQIKGFAPDYFSFLIQACISHGHGVFNTIAQFFDEQWANEDNRKYWLPEWRRFITLEIYRVGGESEQLVDYLETLESEISVFDEVYDRINEYEKQILAWIEVQEPEKANQLIQKLIDTSFGIYSDKDHQFEQWIEWLDKVNEFDHEKTIQRSSLFVAAQLVLFQTRRGANLTESEVKLFETVTKKYPGWAIEIRDWLLELQGAGLISSISGLVQGSLNINNPPLKLIIEIIAHFIVPFQRNVDEILAVMLGEKCGEILAVSNLANFLKPVIDAIETKTYPSNRLKWWLALDKGFKKCGANVSLIRNLIQIHDYPDVENSSEPRLLLKSGESITERSVRKQIHNYEDLLALLDQVEKTDYFQWYGLIEPLLNTLLPNQIEELIDKLKKLGLKEVSQAKLANRLFDLGQRDEAKNIIESLIRNSPNSGWNRWYDGGLKLEWALFKASSEGPKGRKHVFESLIDDYISGHRFPRGFLETMDELIPLLFDDIPFLDIWKEIEEHVRHLADFHLANNFPPFPSKETQEMGHGQMLVDLVFEGLINPVPEFQKEAHRAACAVIISLEENAYVTNRIEEWLSADEDKQTAVLAVLESVVGKCHDYVLKFSDQIRELCIAPSMTLRNISLEIACCLGLSLDRIETKKHQLSPIYNLELPEAAMPEKSLFYDVPPIGEIYPDTDDPLELTRSFLPAFETLTEISGIPMENLSARAVNLMRKLEPESNWNKNAEKKIRDQLQSAEFKMAYRRPRAHVAHRAFGHIVAELYDAQYFDEDGLRILRKYLAISDAYLSNLKPICRPKEIETPLGNEMGDYPRTDWFISGDEHFKYMTDQTEDGTYKLGEMTRFVKQDWEKTEEARFSMICHPDWKLQPEDNKPHHFFYSRSNWLAYKYPQISIPNIPVVSILGTPWFCDNWLALNPRIGIGLGWQVTRSGSFRWVDDNGELMVESLYWKDGCFYYSGPFGYDEVCGEGWILVCSERAFEIMAKKIKPADRVKCIIRLMNKAKAEPKFHVTMERKPI